MRWKKWWWCMITDFFPSSFTDLYFDRLSSSLWSSTIEIQRLFRFFHPKKMVIRLVIWPVIFANGFFFVKLYRVLRKSPLQMASCLQWDERIGRNALQGFHLVKSYRNPTSVGQKPFSQSWFDLTENCAFFDKSTKLIPYYTSVSPPQRWGKEG